MKDNDVVWVLDVEPDGSTFTIATYYGDNTPLAPKGPIALKGWDSPWAVLASPQNAVKTITPAAQAAMASLEIPEGMDI